MALYWELFFSWRSQNGGLRRLCLSQKFSEDLSFSMFRRRLAPRRFLLAAERRHWF
jgi:hypothetical protein